MLSVIIPARNEPYLENTIRDILKNARGEIEIIVLLDGYIPSPQINTGDSRVIFYPFEKSIGQRQAINFGVSKARGEYIMKLDAHCAVDEGFDVKLAADCEYNWTVIPRMYNLDIKTWKPKRHKLTDYMYMGIRPNGELRTEYYGGDEYKRQHHKEDLIDDTMSCMGPCFFMRKDRFLELDGCDEAHGGWGQQGIEVACKAWLSGGRLVVNKKTWFAHWFRGGGGPGFPYEISGRAVSAARAYSKNLWMGNRWTKATRKFEWLIDKFKPPGWGSSTPVLSVIIPSYKDPFLIKTIDSILNNFTGDYEIIPVIDGYKLEHPLPDHPRIRPIILEHNKGMRNAINAGVLSSRGAYLMRTDEHCMFSPGFDTEMLKSIEDNWIVIPRRYYLDPYKWSVIEEKGYVDYEKLIIRQEPTKFTSVKWINRSRSRRKIKIDETMAFQGSCWIMARSWWDKVIVQLEDNGYGPHYQDTTEMSFKTWRAGGKIMLNKNAWFAHKHRDFNRTHQYPLSKAIPEWKYALETWIDDYRTIKERWAI